MDIEELIQQIEDADEVEIMEFDFDPIFTRLREMEYERDKYKGQVAEMIQKAAAKHLPAYREQGEKICRLKAKQAKALELVKGASLIPFRSGGFVNKDNNMGRVYIDLPIIEAKQLIGQLSAIYKEGEE